MSREVPPSPSEMRGLKRDPALVPLSRDHHFALRQCLWLRRAAAGTDSGDAISVARDFLAFHRTELTAHMEDEEAVLFPAVEAFDPEGTARLQREHREIHALAARLGDALTGGLDPRALMSDVASLLDDHIRYEERGYFMEAQARLDGPSLRRVGALLEARRADRSPLLDQTDHGPSGAAGPSSR
ncbi:MAG TPA: hemerythrin domain-containing protein [Vicinamibacteria bacterium]|jgi:hemerythrin-like domain-containing protein|nr:hemerythrin domain-containing protein [Vicinamibacteria bacterium]